MKAPSSTWAVCAQSLSVRILIYVREPLKNWMVHTPQKYCDVFKWDHNNRDILNKLDVLSTEPWIAGYSFLLIRSSPAR